MEDSTSLTQNQEDNSLDTPKVTKMMENMTQRNTEKESSVATLIKSWKPINLKEMKPSNYNSPNGANA